MTSTTSASPLLPRVLKRVGLESLPSGELAALTALHVAWLQTVPFENITLVEGAAVHTDIPHLAEKILTRGRGGHCFEVNVLLAAVLEEMGYRVVRHMGRVWEFSTTPPLAHLVLEVWADGAAYLCDVGFGASSFRLPLPFASALAGETVTQDTEVYRLTTVENGEIMVAQRTRDGASWQDFYSFLPCAVRPYDVIVPSYYVSTSPDSFFTKVMLAAVATPTGTKRFLNTRFTLVGADGTRTERQLADAAEVVAVLDAEFGLRGVDVEAVARRLAALAAAAPAPAHA